MVCEVETIEEKKNEDLPANPEERFERVRDLLKTKIYQKTQFGNVWADDLKSAAQLELWKCANEFDPIKWGKVSFRTYCLTRIRTKMTDALRKLDHLPPGIASRIRSLEPLAEEMAAELGRKPQQREVLKRAFSDLKERRRMNTILSKRLHTPAMFHLEEGADTVDYADDKPTVPQEMEVLERNDILNECVSRLKPKGRSIIIAYYVEGKSMKEIGKEIGKCESRVSQIVQEQLKIMRKAYFNKIDS